MRPDASAWLATRGWKPFAFQREVWAAMAAGESGLLHATTGAGKTYAVWLGALQALADPGSGSGNAKTAAPLSVLWITPMRALAADTLRALQEPLPDLAPHWTAATRTGDTTSGQRTAQNKRLPSALITTPESLSLLLSRADAAASLGRVRVVVVDEWHELLGNKRGVQLQLALARLKRWNPGLMVWGMSATLGNLEQARRTLLGPQQPGRLVRGQTPKKLVIDTLIPPRAERFPWAGHLGLAMLPQVVSEIEGSGSTLVFTNTRAQSELWYQALLQARPDWAGLIALHHGSLDRSVRDWVETSLKSGALRAVVCTSSLDLGVDFLPVERVLQIGSPKGIARLLQRAGRSGHAPGRPSRITLVPTHSLELIEGAAVRAAVQAGQIEAREPPHQPLDVLVQHLVTVALGGGFLPDELLLEVRSTAAYADLSAEAWQWCLDFVSQGGASLAAYPDYHRVRPDEQGIWRVPDARLARRHRANIGTIVSDASMVVQVLGGAKLGTVEESFAARLKAGDCFLFGGRVLELVRVQDMTAWVKRASGKRPAVPRWSGGRMPLSGALADAVVEQLASAASGVFNSPELQAAEAMLAVQRDWSALPTPQTLLAETLTSREGSHLFLYPFAGRHVHLGLASLLAWRVAQHAPRTFSMAVNDYGLELLCADAVDWPILLPSLLAAPPDEGALLAEVLASLNASELAQRRFREIARIAGLIFQSHPGEARSSKQLQASSSLFWEVFKKYDPGNRLLHQAQAELLQLELDITRLRSSLARMASQTLVVKHLSRPTPFAFPLLVERLRETLSNEKLADRIARMVAQLEKAAGGAADSPAAGAVLETLAHGRDALADGASGRPRRERKVSRPLPPL
jgi:ATP-dependent Lhr-like helicase